MPGWALGAILAGVLAATILPRLVGGAVHVRHRTGAARVLIRRRVPEPAI
jgi:hypothetical protein